MKSVTQAVKSMPDNMINTVGGVMDDISKFFGNSKKNNAFESVKVGAGLDTEVFNDLTGFQRKFPAFFIWYFARPLDCK